MIYHLLTIAHWENAFAKGYYKPQSLVEEGFIHCSTKEQLAHSANRHFSEENSLVVMHIVEKRIKAVLKYEPAPSGELFPHIYGRLPAEAVEHIEIIEKEKNGEFIWR